MSYVNRIIDAVGLRLKEQYPDVLITSEEVEQIRNVLPYFFIMARSGGGGRSKLYEYSFRNEVVIDYLVNPDMPKKHEHLQDVVENLIIELERVTDMEGEPYHAVFDSQKYEVFESSVRFNVTYGYKVLVVKPKADNMEEMDLDTEFTR